MDQQDSRYTTLSTETSNIHLWLASFMFVVAAVHLLITGWIAASINLCFAMILVCHWAELKDLEKRVKKKFLNIYLENRTLRICCCCGLDCKREQVVHGYDANGSPVSEVIV